MKSSKRKGKRFENRNPKKVKTRNRRNKKDCRLCDRLEECVRVEKKEGTTCRKFVKNPDLYIDANGRIKSKRGNKDETR